MISLLVRGCMCAKFQCNLDVTFDLGSVRMFSTAIFGTSFPNYKDTWISSTDSCMYFYKIVLSSLTVTLKLINRLIKNITASEL